MAVNILGWVATGVFCASYLFKRAVTLRRVQAFGAGLWIFYGVTIGALPVIVANIIVAGAALYSAFPAPAGDASLPAAAFAENTTCAKNMPCAENTASTNNKNAVGKDADAVPFWLY
jgi:hypothetical protein